MAPTAKVEYNGKEVTGIILDGYTPEEIAKVVTSLKNGQNGQNSTSPRIPTIQEIVDWFDALTLKDVEVRHTLASIHEKFLGERVSTIVNGNPNPIYYTIALRAQKAREIYKESKGGGRWHYRPTLDGRYQYYFKKVEPSISSPSPAITSTASSPSPPQNLTATVTNAPILPEALRAKTY